LMAQLRIEIPEEVSLALRLPPEEAESELRKELALALYARGILPFGKARLLAGVSITRALPNTATDAGIRPCKATRGCLT